MGDAITILMPLVTVAIVIAGAYLAVKWMGKRTGTHSSGRHIQVLERVMLARDAYLALIQVGGKTHLASISSGKVELLREMDPQELEAMEIKRPESDFFGTLLKSLGKNKQPSDQKEDQGGQDGTQP